MLVLKELKKNKTYSVVDFDKASLNILLEGQDNGLSMEYIRAMTGLLW
jgi:hypothetical protein